MGIHRGPNLVKDGLVFGCDTNYGVADKDTSTRFYKGKPTTNEFVFSNFTPSGYGGDGTVQTGALDPFGTTNNTVYRKTGKLRFGPTNGTDVGSLYYGTTSTFSIYLRHVPGLTQMTSAEFDINDRTDSINYVGNLGANMTYEWKRFSVTAYHNNSVNYHFVDLGNYSGTGVFEWCCPQIDLGGSATPFISNGTTRSSTQSLIDLNNTINIDLSNMSFDSAGQPEFDGTNDYVDFGTDKTISQINQGWTAEYVFNTDTAATLQHFNGSEEDTHNAGWLALYQSKLQVWDHGASVWKMGDTVFASNTWYHVAFVQLTGTTMQFYVNGVAEGGNHVSFSFTAAKSALVTRYIGRYEHSGGYSRYFNGHIPVTRLYNKPLNAAEIKQNYNVYKNRFNI